MTWMSDHWRACHLSFFFTIFFSKKENLKILAREKHISFFQGVIGKVNQYFKTKVEFSDLGLLKGSIIYSILKACHISLIFYLNSSKISHK